MQVGPALTIEKPRNGLAGLKHWRHDLMAGLVVSLISLPFSLGIAVASGAPPICGLISAIIAGLVLPFLGGSYVTVSGPAAGLAPVLLASMLLLGRGDRAVGYPLLLGAICLTGLVQVVLAWFKAARFSALFPASVVEGMLASIGLLIIAKQLPLLVGHPFEAHEFWAILGEAPAQFLRMDPKVFFVGAFCLGLIFVLASMKARWLKAVPPQVIAAAVGLVLGRFLGLGGSHLIQIPDHPFQHGVVMPDFAGLLADRSLWWILFTTVLTLTMIDGVESLATISAIDKIDPFRRKSDPNRTLLAMGVSNMCSSMAGGLTIIPGGVKSTACIVGGGRTQWANFYNACFLILYLLLGRNVINMMPMSALGAIVIYTGYKLCAPKVWRHVAHIGREQLFVFSTTVLVTVTTDLLWGIAAGILTKLLLEASIVTKVVRDRPAGFAPVVPAVKGWVGKTGELFRDPVVQRGMVGNDYHLYFGRPMVCFNCMHLDAALAGIPSGISTVYLHITDLVTLVDHTAASTLLNFVENFQRNGRGVAQVIGLDRLKGKSHAEAGLRVSAPVLAQDRARALSELSRLSLTTTSPEIPDPVAYLERMSLTRIGPDSRPDNHEIFHALGAATLRLFRMVTAPLTYLWNLGLDGDVMVDTSDSARGLAWFSLSRTDRGDAPNELERLSLSRFTSMPSDPGQRPSEDPRLM